MRTALHFRRLISSAKNPCYGYRSFTSFSSNPLIQTDANSLVLIEAKGNSRTAILNRPSSLNALNTSTVQRLHDLYNIWECDRDVGIVVLKGGDRAFSAGGDIVALYKLMKEGNIEGCKEFFWVIYRFVYMVGTYWKPHVALLNGITMGGGAGISVPGTFRVATEKTIFATPETLIGFHPDAGASFYLSHLPGYFGEYLALTGDKLSGPDMLSCGLATHFADIKNLDLVEEQLGNLETDDPSAIETAIGNYGDQKFLHRTSVIQRIETVDKCFGHDTVEEIIYSLENEAAKTNDAFCASTLKKLKETAPLSLKVALRSIREGRFQTLAECLKREYRMSLQGISGQITKDFSEGVRAKLVDKDFAPKWDPPSLEHVSEDMVDAYFSRLSGSERELHLPTDQREAFA